MSGLGTETGGLQSFTERRTSQLRVSSGLIFWVIKIGNNVVLRVKLLAFTKIGLSSIKKGQD